MKKRLIIQLSLILILLSSLAFTSAGFSVSITGKVIENCTDTDGGKNYYVKGYVNEEVPTSTDACSLNTTTLMEYYCSVDGAPEFELYTCQYGCLNGACLESPPDYTCTDSDGGKNLYVKGHLTDSAGSDYWDSCDGTYLKYEYSCGQTSYARETYNCTYGCANGACLTTASTSTTNLTCKDSDGGIKIYSAGRAYYLQDTNTSMNDSCIDEFNLREAYCEGGVIEGLPYYCNYGCWGGKCLQESQTNDSITTCVDSDGGKNYYLKGSINTSYTHLLVEDKCSPDGVLLEYFCSSLITTGPVTELTTYICPEGCLDGACIRGSFVCGDGVKDEGETCDGNYSLINMSCSSLGYGLGVLGCTDNCTLDFSNCSQKMCLKGSSCQSGYVCVDGICIKDRKGECEKYCDIECSNGYVEGSCKCECKPYTAQEMCNKSGGSWRVFFDGCADSCDFARNTRNIKCTQVPTEGCDCGPNMCWTGGVCEKTNISTNITCKSSCLLRDICYPLGYRKSGQYCSEDLKFVEQIKSNIACENNFECKSNLCVNSQCVSQNLLQRFFSWFKRN